jgi:hypothetical protein
VSVEGGTGTRVALRGDEHAVALVQVLPVLLAHSSVEAFEDVRLQLDRLLAALVAWPAPVASQAAVAGWSDELTGRLTAVDEGLALLAVCARDEAYARVLDATDALEPDALEELGRCIGAGALAEQVEGATAPVADTLAARWTWESLPDSPAGPPPDRVRPLRITTGDAVPVTGVWVPARGCPNLLVAGARAPAVVLADERIEWEDGGVALAHTPRDAVWSLAWVDER